MRGGGAWLVHREETDVVAALVALHGRFLARWRAGRRSPERRGAHAACNVADVGNDRRGGSASAGARTHERDGRHSIGVYGHRVGHAHDLRDRGILWHHGRMHALLDALLGLDCDTQELDAVSKLVRPGEILGSDRGDALHVDRTLIGFGPERQACQDCELLRRVMAFDVEARISLGVAEPLRLPQALGKRHLLLLHAGQNVIAGAIEDSVDARRRVARKPLAHRFHNGNGAADCGFEIERDMVLLGNARPSRTPCRASSALLAVTTDFLAASAAATAALAGSPSPPISSTNTSISSSAARATGSADPAHPLEIDVAALAARTRAHGNHLDRAARNATASALAELDKLTTDAPTTPKPAIPIFSGATID